MLDFINTYSGVFNVIVSFLTAVITFVYVVFTYKQMRAAQNAIKMSDKQLKLDKQPCVVFDEITTVGTNCFYKSRRQLHIKMKLQNIGDAPALSIYVFSYLKLQHSGENDRVDMYYLPDFVPFLKVGTDTNVSVRYEEFEINKLLEDLSIAEAKNINRINTDATKSAFKGTCLVIEIYYKNISGQWFKNVRSIEILDILEKQEDEKRKTVSPPNSLKDDVWFELQLINPAFSNNYLVVVEEAEIKNKLQIYSEDRPFQIEE